MSASTWSVRYRKVWFACIPEPWTISPSPLYSPGTAAKDRWIPCFAWTVSCLGISDSHQVCFPHYPQFVQAHWDAFLPMGPAERASAVARLRGASRAQQEQLYDYLHENRELPETRPWSNQGFPTRGSDGPA